MPADDLPIVISQRDLAILRSLFESRIMTAAHITALHFNGSYEAAKQRLYKMKGAGLIAERRRRVNEPAILFLTRKAFEILNTEGILSEYPPFSLPSLQRRTQIAEATIRHELEVLDVKAAVCPAVRALPNFSVVEFSTWPALNQFKALPPGEALPRTIQPDGYIHIREGADDTNHRYFLENDRSNEKQDILALKCACYTDYYRTGGFAMWHGAERTEYQEFPFRILIVLKNAERRNNTAEQLLLLNPPIRTQVYLTTLSEVKADPLGPIWIRPAEYREIITGTRFDQTEKPRVQVYKRQSERERFVEEKIRHIRLLADDPES